MVSINTKKQPAGFFIYLSGLSGSGKLSTAIELSNMIDALIVNSKSITMFKFALYTMVSLNVIKYLKKFKIEYMTLCKLCFR